MPDGKWVFNEKFSSMGNGFTFELETMIFWAAISSVSDGLISVYGDDLIIESAYYHDVISALDLLGFTPNGEKSFYQGKFRESCGADYWDGNEVRPCYLKSDLSPKEIYRLHNWALRTGLLPHTWFRELLPYPYNSITGPDGAGDGHLVDPDFKRSFDKRGWEVFSYKSYVAAPRTVRTPTKGDFGGFLYISGTSYEKRPGVIEIPENPLYFEDFLDVRETLASESMYQERSAVSRFSLKKLRVSG